LRCHIASGQDVAVVLVSTADHEYRFTVARLLDAGLAVPDGEASAVPEYYGRVQQGPSSWLKLADFSPLTLEQAGRVTVFSSRMSLPEGLRKSWSGHFLAGGDPADLLGD